MPSSSTKRSRSVLRKKNRPNNIAISWPVERDDFDPAEANPLEAARSHLSGPQLESRRDRSPRRFFDDPSSDRQYIVPSPSEHQTRAEPLRSPASPRVNRSPVSTSTDASHLNTSGSDWGTVSTSITAPTTHAVVDPSVRALDFGFNKETSADRNQRLYLADDSDEEETRGDGAVRSGSEDVHSFRPLQLEGVPDLDFGSQDDFYVHEDDRDGLAAFPPPRSGSLRDHSATDHELQHDHEDAIARMRKELQTPDVAVFPSRSLNEDEQTEMEIEAFFATFRHDLEPSDRSDEFPSDEAVAEAGEVLIYDQEGQSMPFKHLYSGDTVLRERQLIIFVRHFYCGACQAYLRHLCSPEGIPLSVYHTMSITTSIAVIGFGDPNLIPHYKKQTGCPYPIYTDPSRRIYKALGMRWTLNIGSTRPEYMQDISPPAWLLGQFKQLGQIEADDALLRRRYGTVQRRTREGAVEEVVDHEWIRRMRERWRLRFGGGSWVQVGGEFVFQDGKVVWCKRMRNYRGHAEVKVLRRVLEID